MHPQRRNDARVVRGPEPSKHVFRPLPHAPRPPRLDWTAHENEIDSAVERVGRVGQTHIVATGESGGVGIDLRPDPKDLPKAGIGPALLSGGTSALALGRSLIRLEDMADFQFYP